MGPGIAVVVEPQPFRWHPQPPVQQIVHGGELVGRHQPLHAGVAGTGQCMRRGRRPVEQLGLRLGDQPATVTQPHIRRRRLGTTGGPLRDLGPHRRPGPNGIAVERQRVHDLEQMPGPLRVAVVGIPLGQSPHRGPGVQRRQCLRGRPPGSVIHVGPDGRVHTTGQQAAARRKPGADGLFSFDPAHAAAGPMSPRRRQASSTTC